MSRYSRSICRSHEVTSSESDDITFSICYFVASCLSSFFGCCENIFYTWTRSYRTISRCLAPTPRETRPHCLIPLHCRLYPFTFALTLTHLHSTLEEHELDLSFDSIFNVLTSSGSPCHNCARALTSHAPTTRAEFLK